MAQSIELSWGGSKAIPCDSQLVYNHQTHILLALLTLSWPCPVSNLCLRPSLEPPLGRRARERTHFWGFKAINPKFHPMKDKIWKPFEYWYKPVPPVRSHRDYQKCTRSRPWHFLSPLLDRTWPSRQHMSFWHVSWLSDMKLSPLKFPNSSRGVRIG